MPTQAEIIVAGRVLIDQPQVGKLLRRECASDWKAIQKARAIAKAMLMAIEKVKCTER